MIYPNVRTRRSVRRRMDDARTSSDMKYTNYMHDFRLDADY